MIPFFHDTVHIKILGRGSSSVVYLKYLPTQCLSGISTCSGVWEWIQEKSMSFCFSLLLSGMYTLHLGYAYISCFIEKRYDMNCCYRKVIVIGTKRVIWLHPKMYSMHQPRSTINVDYKTWQHHVSSIQTTFVCISACTPMTWPFASQAGSGKRAQICRGWWLTNNVSSQSDLITLSQTSNSKTGEMANVKYECIPLVIRSSWQ